jgi:hypothetical protein
MYLVTSFREHIINWRNSFYVNGKLSWLRVGLSFLFLIAVLFLQTLGECLSDSENYSLKQCADVLLTLHALKFIIILVVSSVILSGILYIFAKEKKST